MENEGKHVHDLLVHKNYMLSQLYVNGILDFPVGAQLEDCDDSSGDSEIVEAKV
jgi:hypothetical protein